MASALVSAPASPARQLAMSCAVGGGLLAAALGASASHASSWQGTRPLAARGEDEGRK